MSISRQHLVPASPTIPSDRSNRALPQYPVPTHPPPHRQHPSPIHNRDAALSGHFANGRMPIPSPAPLDAPRYYHHPSPVVDPESMRDPKAASSSMKKRPRSGSQVQPPRSSDQPPPSGPSRNSVKKKDTKDTVESPGGPPAVLTREKKQKACGNCRRAKLKCIIEGGEGDCIRCKARKEKCIFYPRSNVRPSLSSEIRAEGIGRGLAAKSYHRRLLHHQSPRAPLCSCAPYDVPPHCSTHHSAIFNTRYAKWIHSI